MTTRALWFVVALCALQGTQAFSVSDAVESLTHVVSSLEQTAESTLNATFASGANKINAVVSRLESNLTSAIVGVTTQVAELVQAAENEGISVGSCGIAATANLTKINVGLPISLAHCYIDYLDAFDYYLGNIKKDISASYQAIKDAIAASWDCSLLNVLCEINVFFNATSFEKKKAEDVAFQLADSATAGINLVGTITLCDEEKSTQAVLDVYNVIPATKNCIAAKKAELETSSGSTSS